MRTNIGGFVGIITGLIGGYIAGTNGLPDPWHHVAVVAYGFGMFLTIALCVSPVNGWQARKDKDGRVYMWVRPSR
jgi:hypothetical protein